MFLPFISKVGTVKDYTGEGGSFRRYRFVTMAYEIAEGAIRCIKLSRLLYFGVSFPKMPIFKSISKFPELIGFLGLEGRKSFLSCPDFGRPKF